MITSARLRPLLTTVSLLALFLPIRPASANWVPPHAFRGNPTWTQLSPSYRAVGTSSWVPAGLLTPFWRSGSAGYVLHRPGRRAVASAIPSTLASGVDQPGYACSGGASSDNSGEYSGPTASTFGSVDGSVGAYTGTATTSTLVPYDHTWLRGVVTNPSSDPTSHANILGHWVQAHIQIQQMGQGYGDYHPGFDWGLDSTDANYYYNYNILGFHWDGSHWTLHHDQNQFDDLILQPGASRSMTPPAPSSTPFTTSASPAAVPPST